MSVDDNGWESIRKAAIVLTGEPPGSKAEYMIRVTIVGAVAGSFTPSGLKTDFAITPLTVTNIVTAIPLVSLADRNAMAIRNLSLVDILYIGKSSLTVGETGTGWEIQPNETFNLDVTDAITLYARADVGKSINTKTFEVA